MQLNSTIIIIIFTINLVVNLLLHGLLNVNNTCYLIDIREWAKILNSIHRKLNNKNIINVKILIKIFYFFNILIAIYSLLIFPFVIILTFIYKYFNITIILSIINIVLLSYFLINRLIINKYVNDTINKKLNPSIKEFLKINEFNIRNFTLYPPEHPNNKKIIKNYSSFKAKDIKNLDKKYEKFSKTFELSNAKINL